MSRSRRPAALVLAIALAASTFAAPASAVHLGEERSSGSEARAIAWLDHFWGRLVAIFAAENGGIVPGP